MPKLKITKRSVEGQIPEDRDVILWDTELKGFGCKVTPLGKRSYFLYYRNQAGTQRRPSIGVHGRITAEQARKIAFEWSHEVAQGKDPSKDKIARKRSPTVADVCKRFLDEYSSERNKHGTFYNYHRLIDRFVLPAWKNQKIQEITRKDVNELHQQLRDTPYQANRLLGMISKIMNMAEAWEYRPDGSNPTRHVSKFKEFKRERFLTQGELHCLSDVLREAKLQRTESPSTINAIRLLIATGCRLSEILTLEWAWIDFDRRQIALPDSKTGGKTIHLNGLALEILQQIERFDNNPYVIVGAKAGQHLVNLQKPWRRIREATTIKLLERSENSLVQQLVASLKEKLNRTPKYGEVLKESNVLGLRVPSGIMEVRIHDLRHSFASIAAGLGQDLHMIGKLLGHSQSQTTHRYAHLADDPVKTANEKIGSVISGIMNP